MQSTGSGSTGTTEVSVRVKCLWLVRRRVYELPGQQMKALLDNLMIWRTNLRVQQSSRAL